MKIRDYMKFTVTLGNQNSNIQLTSNLPRFGFCFPAKIFRAVDLPIPLVPTSPKTSPGLGVGSLEKNNIAIVLKRLDIATPLKWYSASQLYIRK